MKKKKKEIEKMVNDSFNYDIIKKEKLPIRKLQYIPKNQVNEYDTVIDHFIKLLDYYAIRKKRYVYNIVLSDLIDWYYENQDDFNF